MNHEAQTVEACLDCGLTVRKCETCPYRIIEVIGALHDIDIICGKCVNFDWHMGCMGDKKECQTAKYAKDAADMIDSLNKEIEKLKRNRKDR